MGYLAVLSGKTYLRLKRTNEKKLLTCHGCRVALKVGDEIIFEAGASRKRYHRACCDRYQIPYDIPDKYLQDRAAFDKAKKAAEETKPTDKVKKATDKDSLNTKKEEPKADE